MTRTTTRRDVIATLPALGAAAIAPSWARAKEPVVSFLSVGDWGRDGASHQRDVAVQMGKAADRAGSRFTVSTGDNFYENGVTSAVDPQWKSSFEDIYTAPALQTPWYALLGNHDYRGVPQAQIDYAKTSARWRMPSRYYKVSGADVGLPQADLFFIDSSPLVHSYRVKVESAIARNVAGEDVNAQLAWLDQELGQSHAPWKLVFGHHTIFSGGSEHGNTVELVAQVKPLLQRHGVQAYICGHEHDLQHLQVEGVNYICTGAGSEVRPTSHVAGTKFAMARSGFAVFNLAGDHLDLEFRDYLGASLYKAAIPRLMALQPA